MLGDYETARSYAEKGLKLQKESGVPVLVPATYLNLARIHLRAGYLDDARKCAEEALKLSEEFKTKLVEALARIELGRIIGEAHPSQIDLAQQQIRQGIIFAGEKELRTLSAYGYLLMGEVFELAGRREEAKENLSKADEMYQEMGMDPHSYWLTRTQEALARLEK